MRSPQQVNFSHAVDQKIAVAQLGEVRSPDSDPVGNIGHGIPEILNLAGELVLVLICQNQFVRNALNCQRIRNMGANVAQTHNTDDSFFSHRKTPFGDRLYFKMRADKKTTPPNRDPGKLSCEARYQ